MSLKQEFLLWLIVTILVSWALLWFSPLFIVLLAPMWALAFGTWGLVWLKERWEA